MIKTLTVEAGCAILEASNIENRKRLEKPLIIQYTKITETYYNFVMHYLGEFYVSCGCFSIASDAMTYIIPYEEWYKYVKVNKSTGNRKVKKSL